MEQKPILDADPVALAIVSESWREENLLKAGALQNAILNSANFSSLATDEKGVIQLFNVGAERMLGYEAADVLNKIETNRYVPVLMITAQPAHKLRAFKAGAKDFVSKPFNLAEVVMGVRNLLEVRLLHLESETRTEQAEERFIQAQKMDALGHLACGVAHDFNNILAVIMGYSELTVQKLGQDHELKSYLETIHSAAERAVGLTRQLLAFSRKQTVQPVVLDLNKELKDLEKMLRGLVTENIEITIIPGKQTGPIKADSGYIGQVLMNLVVNARDAMPHGGEISIATNNVTLDDKYAQTHPGVMAGDYVKLSVSDTGTGMTEEVKARLFEEFFTTKPSGKGTGLGLSTCHTIVQQCGGHIGVYSELGQGTTFKIYFPRVKQTLQDAPGLIQTEKPLPRGTETLLVVEELDQGSGPKPDPAQNTPRFGQDRTWGKHPIAPRSRSVIVSCAAHPDDL